MNIPDHLKEVFGGVCMLHAINAPEQAIENLLDAEEAIKNPKERELIVAGKQEVFRVLDGIQPAANSILDKEADEKVFESKIFSLIDQQQPPEGLRQQIYDAAVIKYSYLTLHPAISEMIENGADEHEVLAHFREQGMDEEIVESISFMYDSILLELQRNGVEIGTVVQEGSPRMISVSGIVVLLLSAVTYFQGDIAGEFTFTLFVIGAGMVIYSLRKKSG